ncbi:MAG: TAT-variant-translocated molybdopterin oxidoreductase, partial [Verrucomicrobiales bacterium]
MKRKWHHPEESGATGGRSYWRSLGELEDTPEFRGWLEREFPRGAQELSGSEADDSSRRTFLKLMGAATSLAGFGMAGCRRPEAFLVPYSKHVEWMIPGKPLLYASAMPWADGCVPLVITTHEGRPTKIEGNPLHPGSGGATDAYTQASILDLYDPDRSKHYLLGGQQQEPAAFEDFLGKWRNLADIDGGRGTAFLVGESSSPSRAAALAALRKKYPSAKFFRYEALAAQPLREATQEAFGKGVRQLPRLRRADKILALDCDFLGGDRLGDATLADFSKRRSLRGGKKNMNRLYAVESAFTVTGGMADHRLRAHAGQTSQIAILFADAIAELTGDATLAAAVEPLRGDVNTVVYDTAWIRTCAEDLAASKGKAVVLAGPRQQPGLHSLVALINQALGAFAAEGGKASKGIIDLVQTGDGDFGTIAELAQAIDKGELSTLFTTTEADPVYDAPGDLAFAEKYASIETTVHLGRRVNATARASTWHLPGASYLESWGDVRNDAGVYSVVQPMILPLYGGISELDLFLAILPAAAEPPAPAALSLVPGPAPEPPTAAYHFVRKTFAALAASAGGELESAWNHALRDGFLVGSRYAAAAARAFKGGGLLASLKLVDFPWKESLEVVFATSSALYDGRLVNNGWMQEVPDPITKLTWDNAALLSAKTARELGVEKDGDMIRVEIGGKSQDFPTLVAPGHADNSLSIEVGYGQHEAGRVGDGTGFDVFPLRTSGVGEYVGSGAKVTVTGENYELAVTAEHYSMEGRAIVREGTLERFKSDESFAQFEGMDAHIPPNISLYKGPDYFNPDSPRNDNFPVDPNHQWGMTIDLNSCIGCNA